MKWATLKLLILQITWKPVAVLQIFTREFPNISCIVLQRISQYHNYTPILMHTNGESTTYNTRNDSETCLWHPSEVITGCHATRNDYACLVLNRNLHVPAQTVKEIWQKAQIRCLVDGGANHWRNFLSKHCQNEIMKHPEYITGDFDSITEETRNHFSAPETKYQHTPLQDETDFTKAIRFLLPELGKRNIHKVIVLQENSGRLDQIMANINTLFKLQSERLNIYLLNSSCLSWLLLPGRHKIKIPRELIDCGQWCALMPIGSRANMVTTTGLKWNLEHHWNSAIW
ncbi:thiamin pyrophosphokinase 1 isoform X2 [Ceratitis capitata]|uniref:thiamin pyrophosphokinase 1 isoform X2 n=1 Tax=Ceratitis capitata TaxID=7213 RepID=UPI000329DBC7|nr:thiamin pyrophosphokinase 1 isoform X2 [Ceratitis capitata]